MPNELAMNIPCRNPRRVALAIVILSLIGSCLCIRPTVLAGPEIDMRKPEPILLGETRQAIQELAEAADDRQFLSRYYALLARHHLVPILRHGDRIAVAAGASIVLSPSGAVQLKPRDLKSLPMGNDDFVRGVARDGQWVQIHDHQWLAGRPGGSV